MTCEAYLIDAFVGEEADGNRAAVVLCSGLPPVDAMQARAAEIAAPATAFVSEQVAGIAHPVRWFGPDREIALCGHGAMAAGHMLLANSGESAVTLSTADRRAIEIRRLEGNARYALALPAIASRPRAWPELTEALGRKPSEIRWNAAGYAIALYSTAGDVEQLAPNLAALSALGNLQVSASAPGGEKADIVSRVFSAGGEDAATGSAHAALAPYWCDRLARARFTAYQASARGGRFDCWLDGQTVWLGGECREAI